MNINLKKAIDNFITTEVYNRALFINGKWGSGKTHFVKHQLEDYVKEYEYGLLYISLNGINSSVELNKSIVSSVLADTNDSSNKSVYKKIKEKFGRVIEILPRADEFFSVFDVQDIINFGNTIFCFDDLERIGKDYYIRDMLGYINTKLLEHSRHKVILIGDGTKSALDNDDFNKISEKYIGWTVTFNTNKKQVIASISAKFKRNENFYIHLTKHQSFIVKICEKYNIDNYRTIEFSLECLSKIHKYLNESHEQIEQEIIYFLFIIAKEFKLGNLSIFASSEDLPTYITNIEAEDNALIYNNTTNRLQKRSELLKSDKEKETELYHETFNKYKGFWNMLSVLNNVRYVYIKSIYDLITTGQLDSNDLSDCLNIIAKSKPKPKSDEHNQNVSSLVNIDNLSEAQLLSNINDAIKDIEQGKLNLYDFCTAIKYLHFLHSWELSDLEHDKIRKLARENFSKIKKPNDSRSILNTMGSSIFYQDLIKYDKELVEMFKTKEAEWYEELQINDLKELIENNNDKLLESNIFTQCMNSISVEVINSIILSNLKNRTYLVRLAQGIREAYISVNAGEFYKSHTEKLQEIESSILLAIKETELDRVDLYYVKSVLLQLKERSEHINSYKA